MSQKSVAGRRKELNELIKIMKNDQKIINRDPDLMIVMEININDSHISAQKENKPKKEEPKKAEPKSEIKQEPPKPAPAAKNDKDDKIKKKT